ncbi:hypothetical protein ABPG72_002341 [Tetrahymena utriculariae]
MPLQQGNQLFDSNQFQQAIAIYDSLSPQDPNYFEALNNKGNCYKCLGQYQKALQIFCQLLSYNDVSKAPAYGNLEMIYFLKDLYDYDKAQYYWKQSNNIMKQIKDRRILEDEAKEGHTDVDEKLLGQSKKLGYLQGRLVDVGNEEEEVDDCGIAAQKKEKGDKSQKQQKAEKTDLKQCCTIF